MKTIYKRALLVILAFCVQAAVLNAQNFQGIATYHAATKLNIDIGSAVGGSDMLTEEIKKQLGKQIKKEYTLRFNLTESTWQEMESLDADAPSAASAGGNVVIRMNTGGAANGILYKNTAEGKYEKEDAIMGKPFLVNGELKPYEWQLTGETRKIGNYNAQKAVFERISTRRSMVMLSGDTDEESSIKEVQDTTTVTAWFTTDIPVSHGPEDYWGLPGLILEVSNGTTTMVCSKVVLNPEEGVELKMPSKGKVIAKEEFDKIRQEKVDEMMKKYSNGGSGATFRISGGNGN